MTIRPVHFVFALMLVAFGALPVHAQSDAGVPPPSASPEVPADAAGVAGGPPPIDLPIAVLPPEEVPAGDTQASPPAQDLLTPAVPVPESEMPAAASQAPVAPAQLNPATPEAATAQDASQAPSPSLIPPVEGQAEAAQPLQNESPAVPVAQTETVSPSEAAQAPNAASADQQGQPVAQGQEVDVPSEVKIVPDEMASVLFTYWEHQSILDARRARGMARAPTQEELGRKLQDPNAPGKVKPPAEERDISLGGIVYNSAKDWTIWLNGKRITPQALPKEVIDLRVFNEYVEMKWFDEYTNQIFPIRLRAHQRFNIDNRIFLPG